MKTAVINAALAVPTDREEKNPIQDYTDHMIAVEDGRVVAHTPMADYQPSNFQRVIDVEGRAIVPGFVDSHTHVVFAGARIEEYVRRSRGETYQKIALAGGGIKASVRHLEESELNDITQTSLQRMAQMLAHGTTTVEVKTGYGLDPAREAKHLAAIHEVKKRAQQDMRVTFLFHGVPKGTVDRGAALDALRDDVLVPALDRGEVHFVDAFVEDGALTAAEAARAFAPAQERGIRAKVHVDQLTDGNGAAWAATLEALSADHLEQTKASGAAALAQSKTIATILPGCSAFLGGAWADGRALRDAGCEVAIATDCNPGSSMVTDLALCGTLACSHNGLSADEALWGITRGGALALDLPDRGTLSPGSRADFVVLNDTHWASLFYRMGDAPIDSVYLAGEVAYSTRP